MGLQPLFSKQVTRIRGVIAGVFNALGQKELTILKFVEVWLLNKEYSEETKTNFMFDMKG